MNRAVAGVVCPDTGRDISEIVNAAARQYGFDAPAFVGGLIAESGLNEHAMRWGVWPDVSPGISQVAVMWCGEEVPGLLRADDGTVLNTPYNIEVARQWFWDAGNAISYTAPRYAANLARAGGDTLIAWCYWNAPGIDWTSPHLDWQHAANRENYRRSLAEAERYAAGPLDGEAVPEPEPLEEPPVGARDPEAAWLVRVVPADGANVRSGPAVTAARIGGLGHGQYGLAAFAANGWAFLVATDRGGVPLAGWVRGDLVEVTDGGD